MFLGFNTFMYDHTMEGNKIAVIVYKLLVQKRY